MQFLSMAALLSTGRIESAAACLAILLQWVHWAMVCVCPKGSLCGWGATLCLNKTNRWQICVVGISALQVRE